MSTHNLAIPYSSKFSWLNIFGNFMVRYPIMEIFLTKDLEQSTVGMGPPLHNYEIFITEINICVIFNNFT